MKKLFVAFALIVASISAKATLLTETSLTRYGATPSGVSAIGGIVFDVVGVNGSRVVSQLSASSLFEGYFNTNPGTIGTQSGWDSSVWSTLGGGIVEAAVRITVDDGDTGSGNFDFNQNRLLVNAIDFGNFSDVVTEETNADGTVVVNTNTGFLNNKLNTGWFFNNDSVALTSLYNAIVNSGEVVFQLSDVDPGDNFFDFKQGIDSDLIDVGTGPVVTPSIPEPAMLALFGLALILCAVRQTAK